MVGCDPKFFFGENVEAGILNAETCIPDVDTQYSSTREYNSNHIPAVKRPIWSSNNDISSQKYSPSQGPWGVIPSRSIMISNLPKTAQLWTLVELLKVTLLILSN
jgi:hypothetical protein